MSRHFKVRLKIERGDRLISDDESTNGGVVRVIPSFIEETESNSVIPTTVIIIGRGLSISNVAIPDRGPEPFSYRKQANVQVTS